MTRATIQPLLHDGPAEAMKLRRLFADVFGASLLAQLIPRLRLLSTSDAELDAMALLGKPWSSDARVDHLSHEASAWST
jgi:hypothetical protein